MADPRIESLHRSWRRALLLTGSADGAERVMRAVLTVQDNPLKLSAARRDRLLIQRAREASFAAPAREIPFHVEGGARQLFEASRALPRQSLEAWLLRDLEGLDEIDAARAMDCSRTAMNRFRDQSTQALRALLGEGYDGALESLRGAVIASDPALALARIDRALAAARRRRRRVALAQVLLLLACLGVVAWVGWDLIRSSDAERDRNLIQESFSSPMPAEPQGAPDRPELREQEQAPPAGREVGAPRTAPTSP
ncbi:MAG TPA: hypothetical protein DEB06_09965 [Phycisphaerales bacterium]|nr:hypothetical protein [Phycisphaerales bacterium]